MLSKVISKEEWSVMHSNQYTLLFTSVLTIILASLLSVAAGSLDQIQKLNVEIDSKKYTVISWI